MEAKLNKNIGKGWKKGVTLRHSSGVFVDPETGSALTIDLVVGSEHFDVTSFGIEAPARRTKEIKR